MSRPETNGHGGETRLSRASATRFSLYLRHLERWHADGTGKVSSGQLGEALGLNDAQVRKDLAYLGNLGQPGIGYNTTELIGAIRHRLGLDRPWKAVVVGIGNLARALLGYQGFQRQGFSFVGLFDNDERKHGEMLAGIAITPLTDLKRVVTTTGAELGVLAVPADAAQPTADALIDAKIQGILNFAPTLIRVPPTVSIVNVDLAMQLEQLAFLVHLARAE